MFIKGAPIELSQVEYLKGEWFKNCTLLSALEPLIVDAVSSKGHLRWISAALDVAPLSQMLYDFDMDKFHAVMDLIKKCKRAHGRVRRRFLAEAKKS